MEAYLQKDSGRLQGQGSAFFKMRLPLKRRCNRCSSLCRLRSHSSSLAVLGTKCNSSSKHSTQFPTCLRRRHLSTHSTTLLPFFLTQYCFATWAKVSFSHSFARKFLFSEGFTLVRMRPSGEKRSSKESRLGKPLQIEFGQGASKVELDTGCVCKPHRYAVIRLRRPILGNKNGWQDISVKYLPVDHLKDRLFL